MDGQTTLPLLFLLLFLSLFTSSSAANFEVYNNCPFTVWAASVPVGGGQPLDQGQIWNINTPAGTASARIWGRTNCKFDGGGKFTCQTGDCGGTMICTGYGKPPNTITEFTLSQTNGQDFIDISLVDGFNIPLSFVPTNATATCQPISCTADIVGQCPAALRDPGGCNNPCTAFGTPEYCCYKGTSCNPTNYSKFFKERCPGAYSYPQDDATSIVTCDGGSTDYRVIFCP